MVPAGAQYPTDAVRLEPPQHGATLAEDPLPPADEALLPAAGKAPSASAVRSALASGERVLAGQAAARLGAAGAEVGEPEKGNPPTGVNSQPPDSGTKNIGFRQSNTTSNRIGVCRSDRQECVTDDRVNRRSLCLSVPPERPLPFPFSFRFQKLTADARLLPRINACLP